MADAATRKRLIWIIGGLGGALILGMLMIKVWFAATIFMPSENVAAVEALEPLDAREQIARNMVTPVAPGTPVMPDTAQAVNPSDYSRELATPISLEEGMDRYLAVDNLLLYYNAEPESGAKVSSSERMIDGATLFVIRRSGLADDAIAAQETFAFFDNDSLIDFGSRHQCRRGDMANQWTTELCV
jgi:hypothetical protein